MHRLAFGRRHPLRAGQPSVYELAAERLERPSSDRKSRNGGL
jgi:hypothetical protein